MLAIGVLYFLLHSTKIAMATYTQSTLIMIIFILFMASDREWKNNKYKI